MHLKIKDLIKVSAKLIDNRKNWEMFVWSLRSKWLFWKPWGKPILKIYGLICAVDVQHILDAFFQFYGNYLLA